MIKSQICNQLSVVPGIESVSEVLTELKQSLVLYHRAALPKVLS